MIQQCTKMIKLKHILLNEWGYVDPGPKRNFKPYGDKYTEFEKATNPDLKEDLVDQAFLDAKPVEERLKKGEVGCCHKCGHSHRKGSAHVTPYRTGKNSCANRKKENVAPNHDGKAAPYGSGYEKVDEEILENLRNWLKQKWVDISRKNKDGSHPKCGASAGKKSRKGGKRAYPKCVPASKAASMSKKDKASATRRKRAAYKNKAQGGKPPKKAKNVATKAEMIMRERLIEKLKQLNEKAKRDKCYYKVKARYDVWPSAYGSLALSKCRKQGAKNWGKKSKK